MGKPDAPKIVMNKFSFDPESHIYKINGNIIPSVTQILRDLIPSYQATPWHMQRGRAAHACYALIAQGKEFEFDPRLAGYVAGCRKFFADLKPDVGHIEQQVYSETYQYAGTYDLSCKIDGRYMLIDYKSTLTDAVPYQLAAYMTAMLKMQGRLVHYGMGVEIHDDGTYRLSEVYDLNKFKNEWLCLLTAFKIRQKFGLCQKENES